MAASLFLLLDDIASVLDDVALLTKVAAKKTAGVLGDERTGILRHSLAKFASSAMVSNQVAIDQPGYLAISFEAPIEARADAEQVVREALDGLAKDGPSPEQLAAAKNQA